VYVAIEAKLRAAAEAWIADDPDERDRDELRGLLDQAEAGNDGAGDAEAELRTGSRAG